mgnify:CR=1 FL=1
MRVSESSLYLSFLGKYCVLFSRLNVFCVAAVFCGFLAPNPQQTTSPAIHPSLFLSPFLSPSLSPLSRSFTFHPLYREPPQLTLEPWTLEAMATTPPMEVWFPCCLLALSLFCVFVLCSFLVLKKTPKVLCVLVRMPARRPALSVSKEKSSVSEQRKRHYNGKPGY